MSVLFNLFISIFTNPCVLIQSSAGGNDAIGEEINYSVPIPKKITHPNLSIPEYPYPKIRHPNLSIPETYNAQQA
jgi:hypothetical protein